MHRLLRHAEREEQVGQGQPHRRQRDHRPGQAAQAPRQPRGGRLTAPRRVPPADRVGRAAREEHQGHHLADPGDHPPVPGGQRVAGGDPPVGEGQQRHAPVLEHHQGHAEHPEHVDERVAPGGRRRGAGRGTGGRDRRRGRCPGHRPGHRRGAAGPGITAVKGSSILSEGSRTGLGEGLPGEVRRGARGGFVKEGGSRKGRWEKPPPGSPAAQWRAQQSSRRIPLPSRVVLAPPP